MSTRACQAWSKLAAVAGMLGSEFDNERANAAKLATAEVKRLGLTWYKLVERAFAPSAAKSEPPPRPKQPEYAQPRWQDDFFRQAENWEATAKAYRAQQQAREQAQRQAYSNPFQQHRSGEIGRWQKRHGLKLHEFASYAQTQADKLNPWERDFVKTFVDFGPKAAGTVAQWRHIVLIAKKLGVPVTEAA